MQETNSAIVLIVICICGSGFFSGSETAVTAVNRYRLQYLATVKNSQVAKTLMAMLQKPQQLLGMILIANTFLNMMVSSLATEMTIRLLGAEYVLVATMLLTFVVLIFAEILPKSIAAQKTDTIAYAVAPVLRALLWLLRPLVYVVDAITTVLMFLLGVRLPHTKDSDLSRDELGNLIKQRRRVVQNGEVEQMLAGILDLDDMVVTDVMQPRVDVTGIDIRDPWADIIQYIKQTKRERILVYDDHLDHILGYVDTRTIMLCLLENTFNKHALLKKMHPIHYVPESTQLEVQLQQFKSHDAQIAVIVDEYGQLVGLVEKEDIIDEVVGEFTRGVSRSFGPVPGSTCRQFWFNGNMAIRDINKALHWHLPEDGATTIGGYVFAWLECIPDGPVSLVIHGYRVEVLEIHQYQIRRLLITPPASME